MLLPIFRLLLMPVASLFILKSKIKELLATSFFISFILSLIVIFVADEIQNIYILLIIFALLYSSFSIFFQLGNNQSIAQVGKEKEFERFFYLSGVWSKSLDFILPMLIGAIITFFSRNLAFTLLSILSLYSIYASLKSEKLESKINNKSFKDIFTEKDDTTPIRINILHYLFIFSSAMVIQFVDTSASNFQFSFSENELSFGILKSFFVLIIFIIFKVKSKELIKDKYWFYFSLALTALTIVLNFLYVNIQIQLISLTVFSIMHYIIHNSSVSMSFKVLDGKDDFGKFSTLFKREIIRNLAKITISFIGFIWAFDNINSIGYRTFSLFIIIILFLSFVLYEKLDIFINEKKNK